MFRLLPLPIIVSALACAAPAVAGQGLFSGPDSQYFMSDADQAHADQNENFVLRGGVGLTSITANEHVYYYPTGIENLSLLVWQSTAPIASIDAKARFGDGWTLRGHVDAAMSGDSSMADYDWLTYAPSLKPADWDNRSLSPNTNLDWYLNGEIAVGRDLPISDSFVVNVNGGLKYTDVQWTAYGGTKMYSNAGLFDNIGNLPDGAVGRYRQQLPTVFAGVDTTLKDGPWNLDVSGKAGLILFGQSIDHHFVSTPPKYIIDQLNFGQVLSADMRIGYDISDHLGAYLEGTYEKMFAGHTPSDYYVTATNTKYLHSDWRGGAELDVISFKSGLKGNF